MQEMPRPQVSLSACNCVLWQRKSLSFADIVNDHLHPLYKMISMKEVYKYKVNPLVRDSIRFNDKTKPPVM